MTHVHIRKQGGAAIITIPAEILKALGLSIGAELTLAVTQQGFIVKPVSHLRKRKRKRYTVKELLKGVTPKMMKKLIKETEWFREMEPVGKEIL